MLPVLQPQPNTVLRSPPPKFTPPASGAHLVARHQIIERIRQAPAAKLILVQAPAGFGKTTLLRHAYELAGTHGQAMAWITLDSGDNDLDLFMAGLEQTFRQLSGDAASQSDHAQGLIEAVAGTVQPFLLVLDEFEQLQNPAALSVLQQIVELLRPGQQILIGTREQPPLSLGRLRARQQLLEIGAEQLRFSDAETAEFLCGKRQLKLDAQDLAKLQHSTHGWAAALWLSSLALEGNADPKRFVSTFCGSSKLIAAYLAEDVLSHKPQHLQDFVLQTSILQQFCADSCNAVTGRADSRELLQELERANLFITALDEQQQWFSYHPLFAEFLRAQLERQYPGSASTLHRRAAIWYLQQKRPIRAIDHALASGDQEWVLALLSQHAEPLLQQGRVRLLARWLDALERPALQADAKLVYVYAWVLIHVNRSAEALALLESIAYGGTSPITHRTYLMLKSFSLVMLDRLEETAPMWDDPHTLADPGEPLMRSMLLIGCAYYYAAIGRYHEARQRLDQALHEHSAVGPLFSVTVAGYIHSMLDLLQGGLRSARARLQALIVDPNLHLPATGARLGALMGLQAKPLQDRDGANSGFASVYLAEVLYELDTLDEARRLLEMYLPLVKEAGVPDQLISSHLIYARILHAQGRANDALQTLHELEQLGSQRGLVRIIDMARLERARSAILDGELDTARTLLVQVSPPPWQRSPLQMASNDIETTMLGWWRLQVHSGQAAIALPALKEHLKDAYRRGRLRYALRVKTLYTLALHRAGLRNSALRTLRETLQEAQTEGFVRVFKDEGTQLLALLAEVLESLKEAACTDNSGLRYFLESIVHDRPPCPSVTVEETPLVASGCSELTGRELDVLRLLAKGHANQAIAEKLFVSVTTVRTHLRNINIKLEAHSRTEALAIARQRAIID